MCLWLHGSTGTSGNWGCVCTFPNCPHSIPNQIVEVTTSEWACTEGTFEWALQQMRQGHKVRRKTWPTDAHVYLSSGGATNENDVFKTVGQVDEAGTETIWTLYSHHLLATDWEIYVKRCGECGRPKS